MLRAALRQANKHIDVAVVGTRLQDAPPIGAAKPFPEGALEAVQEPLRQFQR